MQEWGKRLIGGKAKSPRANLSLANLVLTSIGFCHGRIVARRLYTALLCGTKVEKDDSVQEPLHWSKETMKGDEDGR